MENSKLGIVIFTFCDFKLLSVQALLTTRWHFTSSMIHVLILLPSNSPYYSYILISHVPFCTIIQVKDVACIIGMHATGKFVVHVLKFTNTNPIKMLRF